MNHVLNHVLHGVPPRGDADLPAVDDEAAMAAGNGASESHNCSTF
ncbi:hypothetical protein CSIRO_4162 [Bradyrhizobiaceae bacterium SG-6C]|nr:hypothetical protein CSIRO_4162 [Bradyrhizobiaceae bacterium SG-6C]